MSQAIRGAGGPTRTATRGCSRNPKHRSRAGGPLVPSWSYLLDPRSGTAPLGEALFSGRPDQLSTGPAAIGVEALSNGRGSKLRVCSGSGGPAPARATTGPGGQGESPGGWKPRLPVKKPACAGWRPTRPTPCSSFAGQESYRPFTVSREQHNVVEQYVRSQAEHHGAGQLNEELERADVGTADAPAGAGRLLDR